MRMQLTFRLLRYGTVRPHVQRFLVFLSLGVVAFGCCRSFDLATKGKDDAAREWLRNWPGQFDWVEVLTWNSVAESKVPQAEKLLRQTASAQVTVEQARDLIGQPGFRGWTGTPYLLRAVGDARGNWLQQVFIRPSGEVWVGGGANSRCPVPKQRRAVVAWLEQSPREVYVTFVVGK